MKRRPSLCLIALAISPASIVAATLSFEGSFTHDDDIQQIVFMMASPGDVTLRTWSFAGGTNVLGHTIPAGGFAPILALFDAAGNFMTEDSSASISDCGPRAADPVSTFCWDAYLHLGLSAGSYIVALTQDDNFPNGPTLSDGFKRAGEGDFTGPNFLGAPGAFILVDGSQRSAFWAVDLVIVNDATQVPEPAGFQAVGLCALLLLALRRRLVRN